MRLQRFAVLLGVARADRDPREVQPRQKLTDRAFVHGHAELPADLVAQIHQAPAHELAFLRGTVLHPAGNRRLLCGRQLARWAARIGLVRQTGEPGLVVAMHPVTQRLPVHPGGLGGLRPAPALQHQRQSQHAPRRRRILAPRSRSAKPARVQIHPRDRYRHHPLSFSNSESERTEPAQEPSSHPVSPLV